MSELPLAVAVAGAAGRMGQATVGAVRAASDLRLVAEIDPALGGAKIADSLADARVLVDFTAPDAVLANVRDALGAGVHVVIGTTGFDQRELERICAGASANVFAAPNFAIGAVLMMRFAQEAARHMAKAEIIELHHDRKLDAPSGTALRTAALIGESAGEQAAEVPIHSVRLPGLVAHQEVLFGDLGQTLSIRHDTTSREAFMPGVLLAVRAVGRLAHSPLIGLEHLLWPPS
jgi:4-hydroxy-tetrahydrodipicolinate reductase